MTATCAQTAQRVKNRPAAPVSALRGLHIPQTFRSSPSIQTEQADFPHSAFQLVRARLMRGW